MLALLCSWLAVFVSGVLQLSFHEVHWSSGESIFISVCVQTSWSAAFGLPIWLAEFSLMLACVWCDGYCISATPLLSSFSTFPTVSPLFHTLFLRHRNEQHSLDFRTVWKPFLWSHDLLSWVLISNQLCETLTWWEGELNLAIIILYGHRHVESKFEAHTHDHLMT